MAFILRSLVRIPGSKEVLVALPQERHRPPAPLPRPDTLRQRSLLPSWPEAGKPFGGHPHSPALAVAWGLACATSCLRPHRPTARWLRCGQSPLCFYSLPTPTLSPTPAQAHQMAAVLQKPLSEADKAQGQHRVRDSGAPFRKPPQCRLSPQLCPPRKVTVCFSQSQSFNLPTTFSLSLSI